MAIIAKNSGGHDFEKKLISPGLHAARCIRVIDLGLQTTTYNNVESEKHRIMIIFEIPDETVTIDGREQVMVKSKEFTLSLHENSSLRPFLQDWRGSSFTAKELEGFDIANLIGAPCMLNFTHDKGQDGSVYAKISSIAPIMAQIKLPEAQNSMFVYEMSQGATGNFDNLPEWIQKKILAGRVASDAPQAPSEAQIDEVVKSKPPF